LRALSSALLLVSLVSMPHPVGSELCAEEFVTSVEGYAAVISEFYPCALAGDEYFTISCRSDEYACLRNWSVTDGEGGITFIADIWLFPGNPITVSNNATSYWCAYNKLPDLALDSQEIGSLVAINGSFRLADAGDSLTLISSRGEITDQVIYGSTNDSANDWIGPPMPSLRKGEVAKRLESGGYPIDSDAAADWQPFREFRYGYTEFAPQRFEIPAGGITAFTSPDCSLDIVSTAIQSAHDAISVCTYEFSSVPVCEGLLRAMERGVDLRVMVDGAPAGDMHDDEIACLSVLRGAGAEVRTVNGNLSKGIVQHVGALHAKYLVIDSSTSIIMSENFVEDGLPQNRVVGNRGWGVMVQSDSLASHLLQLFDSDSRSSRLDVSDWRLDPRFNGSSEVRQAPSSAGVRALLEPLQSTRPASITAVASPDGSTNHPYLLDYMKASTSLIVEQFQADLFWSSRWSDEKYLNPLIQSLLASESKGVVGKVLLDSAWFNAERNQQVIDCLVGNSTHSSSSFGLLDERSPITLVHNKGVVIDGTISAVTSNNWVSASFSRNRELAIMIESHEVASHFMRAFEYDSLPDETPPFCEVGPDVELILGRSIVIDADECSDDRQILEYSWDIDADGIIDSHDDKLLFRAMVTGDHVVVLKVTDAWGNSATDETHVSVDASTSENRDKSWHIPQYLWLAPVIAAAGVFAVRLVKRRRTERGSRNINHRPRS